MDVFKSKNKAFVKIDKGIILLCVVIFLQVYQMTNQSYSNYQLKKDPSLRSGEAIEDFCFYTTRSLIDGTFSWRMFDEVTYKGLKADPNFFNFEEDEKVKLVKVSGEQCRVLTISNGRLKGIIITLNASTSNPLYYKAIQINEEELPIEVVAN